MTPVLHNLTAFSFRDIPKSFQEKVKVYGLTELDGEEQSIMLNALEAVAISCQAEGIKPQNTAVMITKDGHVEFFGDKESRAEMLRLIIIKTDSMKDLGSIEKIVCYVEEMCHALWNEDNEIEIKKIVTRVINRYYRTDLNITDIYRREWLEENGYKE